MFEVLPMTWVFGFFTKCCGKFQYSQTTLWGMQSQKVENAHACYRCIIFNCVYSTYFVLQVSISSSFKERLKSIHISILSGEEESWPYCALWSECVTLWVLIDFVGCDLSRHGNRIPHILLKVQVNILSSQQDVCEFMSTPTPATASHRDHQSC